MEGLKLPKLILNFSVENIDAINIPEATFAAPWHRSHVYVHIDKLTGPKSMTVTELKCHYLKYIDEIHGIPRPPIRKRL